MKHSIGVIALAACALMVGISAHAEITIGLYSDYGTSCSFTDNAPGLVTAHVVVRSDGEGFRAVRFAAPMPACFDAVFVEELAAYGISAIGFSQTGISLALPECSPNAYRVMDITYYSNGGTLPCCEFPLVADPTTGSIEALDCNFNTVPLTGNTSYFNADASCECTVDQIPPYPPFNQLPADGASNVALSPSLQWQVADPGGLPLTCDVYLGTSMNPPLVASDVPGGTVFAYSPDALNPETLYYWQVVVRNSGGGETAGPVWAFSTGASGRPVVYQLQPANGQSNLSQTPTLTWVGYDDLPLTYDVYVGTDLSGLAPVAEDIPDAQFTTAPLSTGTQYYWQVVASDPNGLESRSHIWWFQVSGNTPPNPPANPTPGNGMTGAGVIGQTLSWEGSDPEGQSLRYDVYFGKTGSPPLIATNHDDPFYALPTLDVATVYYWRIVAFDIGGLSASGPTWSFTTRANLPPLVPNSPSPADASTAQSPNVTLYWQCSDPDFQSLEYDVYFGTTSPPALAASHVATQSFDPGPQDLLTTCYWRIVARDVKGAETSGPIWSYTTKSVNEPPNAPVVVSPADGAINQALNAIVKWNASDPENDVLNFDVYFGTDASPPLVADHIPARSYDPGALASATLYRWKIVARDPAGNETAGPAWSFTTSSGANRAPNAPSNPTPADGGYTGAFPYLHWECSDPDGDQLTYYIVLYSNGQPTGLPSTTNNYLQVPFPLIAGVYQWIVRASDGQYAVNGPLWTFTVTSGSVVPVTFQSFDARLSGTAVEIQWKLSSDEQIDEFTLYRREMPSGPAIEVARGDVDGMRGNYVDRLVEAGKTYGYELVVTTTSGNDFRSRQVTVSVPALELTLYQNHPNPFNPQTTIRYDLPGSASTHVRLLIVDLSGKRVRTLVNENQSGGSRSVEWNGRDDAGNAVASGVYFYVLDAGKQRLTKKLVLLK